MAEVTAATAAAVVIEGEKVDLCDNKTRDLLPAMCNKRQLTS